MLQIKNQDPWKEKGLKGLQDQINSQNVKTSDLEIRIICSFAFTKIMCIN